jgi:hypothetical protein
MVAAAFKSILILLIRNKRELAAESTTHNAEVTVQAVHIDVVTVVLIAGKVKIQASWLLQR